MRENLNKSRSRIADIEDRNTENKELQEAILKKDLVIEKLEHQLGSLVREEEAKTKRTMEKMRLEYEIMGESTHPVLTHIFRTNA